MTRSEPLSERAFHGWLATALTGPARGLLPIGDDAAALPLSGRNVALLTTDALVEWTHFLPASPPEAIGEAAAGASLSDVAAKGGRPIALTLALLLPAETPPAWAQAVVRGADRRMARYEGAVVGGDTKPAETRAVVGTLLGLGRADRLAPHGGLRPGDELWTTGRVGAGGRAYQRFTAGDPNDRALLGGLLAIEPRVDEGAALVAWAHAMVDTSDGLAEAARRLAAASAVRLEIDEAALPLAEGLERDPEGRVPAIAFFGGDYELLAGLPAGTGGAAARRLRAIGGHLTRIGRVGRGRGVVLAGPSGVRAMPEAGWQPFGRGAPRGAPAAARRAAP